MHLKGVYVMKENGVNWTAAENFLGSVDRDMVKGDHIMNARQDAISYGWNKATLEYILRGIERQYSQGKV